MTKILLTAAMALVLGACGRNNDPGSNVRESFEDPALQNKDFQGKCLTTPIDEIITGLFTGGETSVKSMRTQYRFEGATVMRKTLVYTSLDCSGDIAARFVESGEFDIKPDAKTPTESAVHIDMNFRKVMASVHTAEGQTIANALTLCGGNQWVLGQEVEVTTRAGDLTCYSAQVPRQVANIYLLEGNVLYIGSASKDEVDASGRPSFLDKTQPYQAL